MQLGPMHPHHLPPGALSIWQAHDVHLENDDRRPAPDQRWRALGHASAEAGANPWLAWQVRLPHATHDSVARAMQAYVQRHGSLTCALAVDGASVTRQRLVSPARWAVGRTQPDQRGEENHAAVTAHFDAVATPLGWPTFGFVTIGDLDGSEAGVLLVAGFDHVAYDGLSGYQAMVEVHALHEALLAGAALPPEPAPSHVDHAHEQAEREPVLAQCPDRMAAWRAIMDGDDLAGLPSASGVARGERHEHTHLNLWIASAEETDEFAARVKARGLPAGVALSALLLRAIAALGDTHIRCLYSVHGRAGADWMGSAGWFAGVIPLEVRLEDVDSVTQCIEKVAQSAKRATAAGGLSLPTVSEAVGRPLAPSMVLSYVSGSSFPGHARWAELECSTYIAPPPASDQMHAWITRMPSGTTLDVRAPGTDSCLRWLQTLSELMREGLLRVLGETELPGVTPTREEAQR